MGAGSIGRRAVLGLVASAVAVNGAGAEEAGAALRLTLGTATPGGGFPVYGAAFVAAVQDADPGLAIEPRNTSGSAENVPLLDAAAIDVGLVQGEIAYDALTGAADRAPSRLKVVTAMYSAPGLFVVRGDGPIRTLDDLRGKPVALGAKGSGLTLMGRLVLQASGLDPDRDVEAILLERAGDGPAMVADGRAAALWGGGTGWPGFTAVAGAPGGGRFLAPGPAAIERLLASTPSLRRMSVPAGTYRGQADAIETVGSWSLVLARPTLGDEVAYRLARALDRGREGLARRLDQARETDPRNTVAAVPRDWLHPGVARYLVEAGYLPPR